MARPKEQVSPNRLCDAADAVLQEATAKHGRDSARSNPLAMRPGRNHTSGQDSFEPWEIQEAQMFLARLGVVRLIPRK